ncbi:SagB family peptide dehydrogenase [Paenibacillus sp. TSA_86.1]|uniref:SagB family peptide dehydrogenase n=1 Tax=Paenibacillus sp. TSA_86.1 TaxID=3415649 RepID=UPI0040463BA4
MISDEYLWDLESDRSLLRKLYHGNANSMEEFSSVNLKKLRNKKKWEIKNGIDLPVYRPETEFEKLLYSRRTRRFPSHEKLDLNFISKLLKFGAGITQQDENLFSYPSPGALYPCTLFISIDSPEYEYIYRYNPYKHSLEEYRLDSAHSINQVVLDKDLKKFPMKIFFASDYQLIEEKYGDISYRLVCQETGHIAQNLSLFCEYMNFNSVCIGGFVEHYFKKIVSEKYDLHYVMVVG